MSVGVEALDLQPAFDEGAVRVEARRLAHAEPRPRAGDATPSSRANARDDAVLQREDVVEPSVDLGVGERVAGRDVDERAP